MAFSFLLIAYKITPLQLGEPRRRRLHVAPHSPLDPTEAVGPQSLFLASPALPGFDSCEDASPWSSRTVLRRSVGEDIIEMAVVRGWDRNIEISSKVEEKMKSTKPRGYCQSREACKRKTGTQADG